MVEQLLGFVMFVACVAGSGCGSGRTRRARRQRRRGRQATAATAVRVDCLARCRPRAAATSWARGGSAGCGSSRSTPARHSRSTSSVVGRYVLHVRQTMGAFTSDLFGPVGGPFALRSRASVHRRRRAPRRPAQISRRHGSTASQNADAGADDTASRHSPARSRPSTISLCNESSAPGAATLTNRSATTAIELHDHSRRRRRQAPAAATPTTASSGNTLTMRLTDTSGSTANDSC